MAKAPNFLLFINDQHRADHVGCYGNDVVRTPHIDGLAGLGTTHDLNEFGILFETEQPLNRGRPIKMALSD